MLIALAETFSFRTPEIFEIRHVGTFLFVIRGIIAHFVHFAGVVLLKADE